MDVFGTDGGGGHPQTCSGQGPRLRIKTPRAKGGDRGPLGLGWKCEQSRNTGSNVPSGVNFIWGGGAGREKIAGLGADGGWGFLGPGEVFQKTFVSRFLAACGAGVLPRGGFPGRRIRERRERDFSILGGDPAFSAVFPGACQDDDAGGLATWGAGGCGLHRVVWIWHDGKQIFNAGRGQRQKNFPCAGGPMGRKKRLGPVRTPLVGLCLRGGPRL